MGTTEDNQTQLPKHDAKRPVRLAYTLNNNQPVRCTIVSDQPFFYTDADITEDDDILVDESMDVLDADIARLKKKIDAYEKLSMEFARPVDQIEQEFRVDADEICKPVKKSQDPSESATFLIEFLQKSRMAAAMLEVAEKHGVALICNSQVETALYDRKGSCIIINPNLAFADQVLLAARELRCHWQHRSGALLHPLTFHPDQAILANRARYADLGVAMVRVAWELQLAGEKAIWERVEHSQLADLGRAFAREAHVDFRTINNGNAGSAVFETWFLSDRCRRMDKELIQAMLADYQGYVFGEEQSSRTVTMDLISALGSMPFGKNYLYQYAQMILSDPIFTEVRDRSNANFLWFIKFERSFREAEQELQSRKVIHSHDTPHGASRDNAKDFENEQKSEVIPLSSQAGSSLSDSGRIESGDAKHNVIYVQFCTGKAAR